MVRNTPRCKPAFLTVYEVWLPERNQPILNRKRRHPKQVSHTDGRLQDYFTHNQILTNVLHLLSIVRPLFSHAIWKSIGLAKPSSKKQNFNVVTTTFTLPQLKKQQQQQHTPFFLTNYPMTIMFKHNQGITGITAPIMLPETWKQKVVSETCMLGFCFRFTHSCFV